MRVSGERMKEEEEEALLLRSRKETRNARKMMPKKKNFKLTVLPELKLPYPPENWPPHPLRPLHQRAGTPACDLGGQVLLSPDQGRPNTPGTQKHRASPAEPAE